MGRHSPSRVGHVTALERLADYVEHLPLDHPILAGLCFAQGLRGVSTDSIKWEPGNETRTLLSLIGTDRPSPPAESVAAELLFAEVESLAEHYRLQNAEVQRLTGETRKSEARINAAELRAQQAEEKLTQAQGRVTELEGHVADLERTLDYFREVVSDKSEPEVELKVEPVEGEVAA